MWPGDCLPPSFFVAMHTFPSLLPLIRVSKKYIRTKRCLALETHATQCSTYLESLTVAVTATWSLLNNVKITSFVVLRRPLSPSTLSPRGTLCGACEEAIPMRLGKQAYVCRDCGLGASSLLGSTTPPWQRPRRRPSTVRGPPAGAPSIRRQSS